MQDVVGALALIVAFCGSVIFVLILLENDKVDATVPRSTGWWSPLGLALSAAALSGIIWLGTLLAYNEYAPSAVRHGCEGKSAGAEFWSWIIFADSVALFLGLTFFTATRLRVGRLGTIAVTAIAMSPLILLFALLLDVVNRQPFCGN